MNEFDTLVDAFLEHFWSWHPVDASFAGVDGSDHLLPPAGREAPERERLELREFERRLAHTAVPDDAAARLDAQLMRGYVAGTFALDGRTRYGNPAWYTGEIAFGLISLLLPGPIPRDPRALAQRIAAIPDQLADAREHLAGRPVPADWIARARLESAAICRLIERGFPLHPLAAGMAVLPNAAAVRALLAFDALLATLPDADPAAGADVFALLARDVHALPESTAEIERAASAEFARLRAELDEAAARLDAGLSWRASIERYTQPDLMDDDAALASLAAWNERALADADALVTPARDYGLTFAPMPDWAREVYADLYFLFYRAPAAYRPGPGSVYWVTSPQSTPLAKLVHAVHHGSIGHHTQNARARSARSRLARIAGGDGASGIALLGGGTIVEGWACYAEELLAEVPDFYTPHELLLLTAFELRNVATCLGDIRLHTGQWSLADMRRFYRDDAAFSEARIWSETTRNSMFPASRVMYWMGTRRIRALRAQSPLVAKAFHDRLLSFGAAPVSAIARELSAPSAAR